LFVFDAIFGVIGLAAKPEHVCTVSLMCIFYTICAGRSRVRACRYISSRKTVVWRH